MNLQELIEQEKAKKGTAPVSTPEERASNRYFTPRAWQARRKRIKQAKLSRRRNRK